MQSIANVVLLSNMFESSFVFIIYKLTGVLPIRFRKSSIYNPQLNSRLIYHLPFTLSDLVALVSTIFPKCSILEV
jgi:hypothetical protein